MSGLGIVGRGFRPRGRIAELIRPGNGELVDGVADVFAGGVEDRVVFLFVYLGGPGFGGRWGHFYNLEF